MLNIKQKDLLTSLIVGDGCMCLSGATYYLSVGHSDKQKDYCQWKLNLLNESGIFKDKTIKMHTKLNGKDKKFILYLFKVGSFKLKFMYDKIIVNKRKSIDEILKMLTTKQGLAIWFMDDGGVEYSKRKMKDGTIKYYRPNMKLCTNCFTYEENLKIKDWFKRKYGVNCNIKLEKAREKNGIIMNDTYYLRFNVDDVEKLYNDVLVNYVHCCPSMEHKFRYAIQAFE